MAVRDTRNMVFGVLPLEEEPGGDEAQADEEVAVRQRHGAQELHAGALFQSRDHGRAGRHGRGQDQAPGHADRSSRCAPRRSAAPTASASPPASIRVRLPVMVQPNLPRFVRPGDQFTLGPRPHRRRRRRSGRVELQRRRADAHRRSEARLRLDPETPVHLDFPVSVPTPGYTTDGELARSRSMSRSASSAAATRRATRSRSICRSGPTAARSPRVLADLVAGQPFTVAGDHRAGPAGHAAAARCCSRASPAWCGWRPASTTPGLSLRLHRAADQPGPRRAGAAQVPRPLMLGGKLERLDRDVKETIAYDRQGDRRAGLVSFWPGSQALCLPDRLVRAVPGRGARCRLRDRRCAAGRS